jgi:hypothetical protein
MVVEQATLRFLLAFDPDTSRAGAPEHSIIRWFILIRFLMYPLESPSTLRIQSGQKWYCYGLLSIIFYQSVELARRKKPMSSEEQAKKSQVPFRELIRNFVIEMIVYGIFLVIYFLIALRYLAEPLSQLFNNNLIVYAILALGLIVVQAVFLEFITSLLFDFLGLHRLTSKPNQH